MSRMVGAIDLDRKYTIEEIMALYAKDGLRGVGEAGYIPRASYEDGMITFVPASESTLFRMPGRNTDTGEIEPDRTLVHQSDDFVDAMRADVDAQHPMVRRSAQQKREALVRRLLNSMQAYGTLPGFTDEQISTMIGEPWITGVSVVTAEMVSRIAAGQLGQGEKANKAEDSKRTTRQHALA